MNYDDWAERLNKASKKIDKYKTDWERNEKYYNGLLKHFKGKQLEYYSNIIWQSYQTDSSVILPIRININAVVDCRPQDAMLNAAISSLLEDQLDHIDNYEEMENAYMHAITKGYGILALSIRKRTADKYVLRLEDEVFELSNAYNKINIKSINPIDIIYDMDNNTNLNTLDWLAVKIEMPIKQFKEGDYKNKKEILNQLNYEEGSSKNIQTTYDKIFSKITILEIWDTLNRKILFLENVTKLPILDDKDYPIENESFNYPFVFLSFTNTTSSSLPPISELDLCKAIQDSRNEIKSAQHRDLKRGVRHYFAPQGLMSPQEERKLQSTDKPQIIKVDPKKFMAAGLPIDLRQLLIPTAENTPLPDYSRASMEYLQDLRETIGYGSMERGGIPTTQTASEANIVFSMLSKRQGKRLSTVLNCWQKIAEKSLIIVKELYPKTIKYKTKKEGFIEAYKEINKDMLNTASAIDIVVSVGTTGIPDKKNALNVHLQMANMLFPLAQQLNLDFSYLIRKILLLADWKPDEIESLFSGRSEIAKQLAIEFMSVMQHGTDPQGLQMAKIWGLVSQLIQIELTPLQIAEIQGKFSSTGGVAPNRTTAPEKNSVRETKLEEDINK